MSSTVTVVFPNLKRRALKPIVGSVTASLTVRDDLLASQSTTVVLPLLSRPTTSTSTGCFEIASPMTPAGRCPEVEREGRPTDAAEVLRSPDRANHFPGELLGDPVINAAADDDDDGRYLNDIRLP